MSITYTKKERTEKNYTMGEALKIAKMLLNGRPVCTNALGYYSLSTKITLVELNDLVERMVENTRFYG